MNGRVDRQMEHDKKQHQILVAQLKESQQHRESSIPSKCQNLLTGDGDAGGGGGSGRGDINEKSIFFTYDTPT